MNEDYPSPKTFQWRQFKGQLIVWGGGYPFFI